MILTPNWTEYELLDSGDKMKLERWGLYLLARPEPQALWPKQRPDLWEKADATFTRAPGGTGGWKKKTDLPDEWAVSYKKLTFKVKPASFKHTGIFPEQASNWDWIDEQIEKAGKSTGPIRVLNLFGYTGGASLAAAKAGAKVVHVDASKGTNEWAKENALGSGISEDSIRFLEDDALKFVAREARRNNSYEGIIMDPPSYGRGAKGELWKLEDHFWELVSSAARILSEKPLFFLVNSYTTGVSATVIENMLSSIFEKKGTISVRELGLAPKDGFVVPAGVAGRWHS